MIKLHNVELTPLGNKLKIHFLGFHEFYLVGRCVRCGKETIWVTIESYDNVEDLSCGPCIEAHRQETIS